MYCRNLLVMALLLLAAVWAVADETTIPSGPFFATPSAGPVRETLAADLLSERFKPHSALSFSPDGTIAAWSAFYDVDPSVEYDQRIFLSYYRDGRWSEPELAPFAQEYMCGGPIFSADGLSLVFTAQFPLPGDGDPAPNRVWLVDNNASGWGEPRLLTSSLHDVTVFSQIALANSGRLYFGSRQEHRCPGIFSTDLRGEDYGSPNALAGGVNSAGVETDIWVDPLERYLIFTGFNRPEGVGGADLYLCLAGQDGGWSQAINLGTGVNTEGFERFGSVSADGSTLYWVHADGQTFPGPNHHFQRISMVSVLNNLGYGLLTDCDPDRAHDVFKLATELYPDQWNAWDSLADAHKALGDSTSALQAYDRALQLNPEAESPIWGKRLMEQAMLDLADETSVSRIFKPGENTGLRGAYLDQNLPGLEPELFAPGIISNCGRLEYNPVFTPDGDELYFSTNIGLMVCYLEDEGWTAPEPAPFSGFEPHITADGTEMFIGRGPEIWRLKREDGGWDKGENICPGMRPWTDAAGNLYVTDIHSAGTMGSFVVMMPRQGNGFGDPVALPACVNKPANAGHPCVSADGSLLIFDSFRTDEDHPKPHGDFYLSRRNASGEWGQAVPLPQFINTAGSDFCASFTHDGKYLFYTANRDIYWVDARVLDQLR